MRRMRIALSVAGAVAAVAAGGALPAAGAGEVTELRERAARDLTLGRCSICHSVEYIPPTRPP